MNTEPQEQEEPKPARHRPVVVKLRTKTTGVRLVGCPAYPTTGLLAGATVEWCRAARGKMAACAACEWHRA